MKIQCAQTHMKLWKLETPSGCSREKTFEEGEEVQY